MTTYQDIRLSRKLIWAGIAVGYAIAVAIAVFNFSSEDGTVISAVGFLLALAIPPSLAQISLDRRPSLLTAASMAALVQGVLLLTAVVGLLEFVPAILWTFAGQRRPRPPEAPGWATWGRPLLAAAVIVPVLVTFLHLDPRCTVTAADGTVISTTVDTSAPSGWSFQLGSSGSSSTSADGVATSCESNTQQPWESLLSMGFSVAIIGGVYQLWPRTGQSTSGSISDGALVPHSGRPA
jgi:hypothetical protein